MECNMKKLSFLFCSLVVITLFLSCNDRRVVSRTDTMVSGVADVAVDECLAPILQQEIDVFEALNQDAIIVPTFAEDIEVYDLLVKDSLRVAIGTRELTQAELEKITARKQRPRTQKIAIDAIALIVNKNNADTMISVSDLRRIMSGEFKTWKELNPKSSLGDIAVAFDSPNSSTVRFMKDSITGGQPFGANIKAISEGQKTVDVKEITPNQKVIDYVASTPNAMGVIGVNWISSPTDTTSLSFINTIRVMSVSKELKPSLSDSYKPYAAYLALEKYPLRRDVFIIISDVSGGLPSGFVNFVAGDKGQRIILKSGLLPATRPMRLVRVNPN